MALRVYNSLTRHVDPFAPADPAQVTVYVCGPTVYDHAHIGNWSTNVFADVLVRWLRASGHGVRYVMNITDVEDKILRDARKAGLDRATFTKRWEDVFFEDWERLGLVAADAYPRATEHVEGMARMIQALLDRGHAYLAKEEDGSTSVYYRVASFPAYGELANLSPEDLKPGASRRVRADEYEKEGVGDFALWKGWTPEDGDVAWEPVFQVDGVPHPVRGRPGWHIECSVMSTALLGDQIDLHLGGEDLRFPHHQNEIAQTEPVTGKRPFVRFWMHRRHLLVDGGKMSKSKGNFYVLDDLVRREGPSAVRGFRYLVVQAHYRTPINFTWESLDHATRTLRNLDDAWRRMERLGGRAEPSDFADEARRAFAAAMDDDLETSRALAALQSHLHEANRSETAGTLRPEDAAATRAFLDHADQVLGLGFRVQTGALTEEQKRLLEARERAREQRRFDEADRLRGELASQGVFVKDTKEGQEVTLR